MNHTGATLSEFFRRYLERGEPLVLATIVETQGSTYRKPGAQMLIAGDGAAAGLLSGGCVESDLFERAREVIETGLAARVEYDARGPDDLIWGIGLGCEGAMSIVLSRLDEEHGYQPFAFIEQCRNEDRSSQFAIIARSSNPAYALGASYLPGAPDGAPPAVARALAEATRLDDSRGARRNRAPQLVEDDGAVALLAPIETPPQVLLLGAGPDAMPVVELAGLMGWRVDVLDHRPAYVAPERFPRARRVALNPANALATHLAHSRYDAAVVMSHHLLSDQAYLEALADSTIPYVGLLGPAPRRARLLAELGDRAERLKPRLRGPIGLDIGADTPETIALAIVSEIKAVLAGRPGGSFSERL